MTVARQFNSLLVGFTIVFACLLLSETALRDEAPGTLLGLVLGCGYYLVSQEKTSAASRSVGFVSLVTATALFWSLLKLLGKTHPMMAPKVELSVAQLALCVVGIVLGPCMVLRGGARVACPLARKGAQSDSSLEL